MQGTSAPCGRKSGSLLAPVGDNSVSISAVSDDRTSDRAGGSTSGSERNQSTNPFSVLASRTRSGAATGSESAMPADAGSFAQCYCPMGCLVLRKAGTVRKPLQHLKGQGCVVAESPLYLP